MHIQYITAFITLCFVFTVDSVILTFDDLPHPELKQGESGAESTCSMNPEELRWYKYAYGPISEPYHNYLFTKTELGDTKPLMFMNTSNTTNFYFKKAVISEPNIMITDGDTIMIRHKNPGWRFSLISIVMMSVYQLNMRMSITRSGDNGKDWEPRIVGLQMGIPRLVVLDWHNLDNVTIGCVQPDSSVECGIVAYDNIILD